MAANIWLPPAPPLFLAAALAFCMWVSADFGWCSERVPSHVTIRNNCRNRSPSPVRCRENSGQNHCNNVGRVCRLAKLKMTSWKRQGNARNWDRERRIIMLKMMQCRSGTNGEWWNGGWKVNQEVGQLLSEWRLPIGVHCGVECKSKRGDISGVHISGNRNFQRTARRMSNFL